MDAEAAVAGHVTRSRRALGDMFEQGGAILGAMAGSRERIKAAHKKALDVVNSVGLGESVLRVIERRHKTDAYIAVGGMACVVLLTVWLLWYKWG
jgi:Golgi SNAP receptor complex protein 2